MIAVFDGTGKKINLGKKIGAGGEGAVYNVEESGKETTVVAKIYHAAIPAKKQTKLKSMVKVQHDQLSNLAAWPLTTVHKSEKSPVCGFLMPKIVKADALHHLYSPAQRKQKYPAVSWSFLVSVARNIAAAFSVIHRFGHVIGDVNPNLVFFSNDSRVKLIDCDSFQINDNGQHYFCKVGVPNFTPPELQNLSSFRGVQRLPNHDNFGLALLVFHLLLMGRHPFAGVYSGSGDLPLKKAIAEFRYAYSSDASKKQMKPPPNSMTPAILPSEITSLFEQAFSEHGAQMRGRPTASDWLSAIESLQTRLRTCESDAIHKFSASLSRCPWCVMERTTQVYFFLIAGKGGLRTGFSLAQVWKEITDISFPVNVPLPKYTIPKLKATRLPLSAVKAKRASRNRKAIALLLFIWAFLVSKNGVILALIALALAAIPKKRTKEWKTKQAELDSFEKKLKKIEELWAVLDCTAKFRKKYLLLESVKQRYEGLKGAFEKENQKLKQDVRNSQYRKFLDNAIIANHSISGVGRGRTATLASFGIESALDISWKKVFRIKGFGEKVTNELVQWRKTVEKDFLFNPAQGVAREDAARIRQKYILKQKKAQAMLLGGAEQLALIKEESQKQRDILSSQILSTAKSIAQAKTDLKLF